jgi:hypothetical protein
VVYLYNARSAENSEEARELKVQFDAVQLEMSSTMPSLPSSYTVEDQIKVKPKDPNAKTLDQKDSIESW